MANHIKNNQGDIIQVLSKEEVIALHNLLTSHPEILKITEAVSPSGVKDMGLLESAVGRQMAGFEDYIRYSNVHANCATLVYGIACNHAFHNGNKRAALLCMLKHLYRNGFALRPDLSNDTIYEFLRSIAAGTLKDFALKHDKSLYNSIYRHRKLDGVDTDLAFIELWIRKNSVSKNNVERPLQWRLLFEKLKNFKIEYKIDIEASKVILTRVIYKGSGFLFFKERETTVKTYPYKGDTCSKNLINDIRRDFSLTKSEGLDSVSFYSDYTEETFIDAEILLFKKAIYKLSKN